MDRPNARVRHTTVNLYEEDVETLRKKCIPISDALRELVHYLCINDLTNILDSVKYGQLFTQINELQDKLEQAREQRSLLDQQIADYTNSLSLLLTTQADFKSYQDNQDRIDRICEIGKAIDRLMYRCNYDIPKMREANIPELKEMEEINPGWSLEEHIRVRKSVGDGSCVSIQ